MTSRVLASLAVLVVATGAWADGPSDSSPAAADDARAEKILAELKSTWVLPAYDRSRGEDPDYVQEYERRLRMALESRVELIGEFHRIAPGHPMTRELMSKRWSAMMHRLLANRRDELVAEVGKIAAEEGNPLHIEATYLKALLGLPAAREGGPDAVLGPIEAFLALAPEDERGAQLLHKVAELPDTPPDRRSSIHDRILAKYPDSRTARSLRASDRRAESIGKPFMLRFRDAIGGEAVSVQEDLKGKVVVLDFWATWCSPCIREIPALKDLYAKYHGRGVEFIGVSLDAPNGEGLEAFKTFVEENRIGWPQFHGEEASEFARSWGVTVIPSVFVVDAQGKLYSREARGRLDALIPELLEVRPASRRE